VTTPIPFIDLKAQYARIKPEIERRIAAVLDHGNFIMGPEVKELEAGLAAFCGCKHAIGVASGTDALLIALMALDAGPGDAVFVPSFTFTATAEAVLLLRATPVFVDVDAKSFNIDPADLEKRIAAVRKEGRLKPKAVIAVDLFGYPADYAAISSLAAANGMTVIADAAQSFGGSQGAKRVGALASITATSFFPAKPLGGYGDGGAIMTDDGGLAETMRSIRVHGQGKEKYDIVRVGVNGRLDTLQAAILLAKLGIFEGEIAAREKAAQSYDKALAGLSGLITPFRPKGASSAWAQYSILLDKRDDVAHRLKGDGVPTAVYYPRPMHLQSAYRSYGGGEGSLPVSEGLCQRILSLPMHPYLTEETIERVAAALRKAVAG
jgi:UDP-2-acetamido-2-deoxy-ribo-hexuluronate aminotransferase